jgi:hypothetical protein
LRLSRQRGRCSTTTSSGAGKRCRRRSVTSLSRHQRTPCGYLSCRTSESSSSPATSAPTAAGTI